MRKHFALAFPAAALALAFAPRAGALPPVGGFKFCRLPPDNNTLSPITGVEDVEIRCMTFAAPRNTLDAQISPAGNAGNQATRSAKFAERTRSGRIPPPIDQNSALKGPVPPPIDRNTGTTGPYAGQPKPPPGGDDGPGPYWPDSDAASAPIEIGRLSFTAHKDAPGCDAVQGRLGVDSKGKWYCVYSGTRGGRR
jgi:hypothetical protein